MESNYEVSGGFIYELIAGFFSLVFHIFFRVVQLRGSYKIPKSGPVIFVAAPHANQFVDPMLLIVHILEAANRHVSFLIAEKSLKRPFVGWLARQMQAVSVGRSQDTLRNAEGTVSLDKKDNLLVHGVNTEFTKSCKERGFISVVGSNEMVEIKQIISDTQLKLKSEFSNPKSLAALERDEVAYRVADRIDNSHMFRYVFDHLAVGHCIGVFPEGGSHDRTQLLSLKPGVAIMALGTVAKHPGTDVTVVPVGMHYYHPNKFRSRAVIEFGTPLKADQELVEQYEKGGKDQRKAISSFLSQIADALEALTINCADYETLMLLQAGQRLYRPVGPVPLPLSLEFTRRFVHGYNVYKDTPEVVVLREKIAEYNKKLDFLGIKDHQVPHVNLSKLSVFNKLVYRVIRAVILLSVSVPGAVLFAPVFIATKVISRRKAAEALKASSVKIKGTDVIATWKVLVALWLVPTLYTSYSALAAYICCYRLQLVSTSWSGLIYVFVIVYGALIFVSYAALYIGEAGLDIVVSLRPLILSLSPYHTDALANVREMREELVFTITELVNRLGPELFPDLKERLEITRPNEIEIESESGKVDPRTDLGDLDPDEFSLSEVPVFSNETGDSSSTRSESPHSAPQESDSVGKTTALSDVDLARRMRNTSIE